MPPPSGSETVSASASIGGRKVWATSSGVIVALGRLGARDLESPP
jgi:hypothetical protein